TTVRRTTSEKKMSAAVFCCWSRRTFRTSYMTIVGTMSVFSWSSRYGSNNAFFVSAVRYSSHPEESTRKQSQTVLAGTVAVLPFNSFCYTGQIPHASWRMNSNRSIQDIQLQFLARSQTELFAHLLGNYDLKFGRDFHHFHCFTSDLLSTEDAQPLDL